MGNCLPPAICKKYGAVLAELHQVGTANEPIVHRNITPQTILVKHDNSPILMGFERTRIPCELSVASSSLPTGLDLSAVAPEVQAQGFAAADCRSDVYSLCVGLARLFAGRKDELSGRAAEVFSRGLVSEPEGRINLVELREEVSRLLGDSVPPASAPPSRFWTEDQVIRFRERDYRILARLGSGGVGTTFKVIEIDRGTREELGTYVAKVAHEGKTGRRVLRAYSLGVRILDIPRCPPSLR